MGEFNGGCTAADGCREQPLLAVILQEGNVLRERRGLPRPFHAVVSLSKFLILHGILSVRGCMFLVHPSHTEFPLRALHS